MKSIIFTFSLLFISIGAFAQFQPEYRVLGDKAFTNKNYYEAAYYYKKAAENMHVTESLEVPFQSVNNKNPKEAKAPDVLYISYRLAESYRLYENFINAEGWYYKVLSANDNEHYPLCMLWYGVCLRADQHFDEALKQLQQFVTLQKVDDNYTEIAKKEIANCNFAKEHYKYPTLLDITKMNSPWNSDGSDYAIYKMGDDFWFTSSRYAKGSKKHVNMIYKVSSADSVKPEIVDLKGVTDEKETEYGTPALSPDGNRLYFTKWTKVKAVTTYEIYFTEFQNNQWSPPVKLNSNVDADGFNSIQPFVTTDGSKLFFASTKPGGQGGYDIWEADLDSKGIPINSINLGSKINSSSDEQAPYYDIAEKKLIYSSKGFIGLGGFDFFETSNDNGSWSTPQNMGYPMNSAKDDLYFFPGGKNKFYISSDRQSDCCLDLFEVYDKRVILAGVIRDCDNQKLLTAVKVSFVDSISKDTIKKEITGANAKYSFPLTTSRPYKIVFEKKGYFTKVFPSPFGGKVRNDTLNSPDICLQRFEKNKPIAIKNVLFDFNKADLRPESKKNLDSLVTIMKDNPKIIVELASHTDSIGSDDYNLKLSQARAQSCVDYIISSGIGEKRIFARGYGKTRPIAPNSLPNGKDNPEGRQLNRRTEFTVIKTED